MISTPRPFRRQSGARRVASQPEACETRTLLSATEIVTAIKAVESDAPMEVVADGDVIGAEPELVVCDELVLSDEYLATPMPDDQPFDPSEFIRFMSFGISGPGDESPEATTDSEPGEPIEDNWTPENWMPEDGNAEDWTPADVSLEGMHPEWAYRTLVTPDGDSPDMPMLDEQPVGYEFIDGEAGPEIELIDPMTLDGWDPSWSWRDFTYGGDPIDGTTDDEMMDATGMGPDGSWIGWDESLACGVVGEEPVSDGEYVVVTAEESPDFSQLTPEEQEFIRNFFGVTLDLIYQFSESLPDDGELPPDFSGTFPDGEVWTFGGSETTDGSGGEFEEKPLDDELINLADSETVGPVLETDELAYMTFLPMAAGMAGGPEVQRTLDRPADSSMTPVPTSMPIQIQPVISRPAVLFAATDSSRDVALAPVRQSVAPTVTPVVPTRSAPRPGTQVVRNSGASLKTTSTDFGLTPLFDETDETTAADAESVQQDDAPVIDDAEVSKTGSTPANANRTTVASHTPPTKSVAIRTARSRTISIDQFMSQFAQDSFIA